MYPLPFIAINQLKISIIYIMHKKMQASKKRKQQIESCIRIAKKKHNSFLYLSQAFSLSDARSFGCCCGANYMHKGNHVEWKIRKYNGINLCGNKIFFAINFSFELVIILLSILYRLLYIFVLWHVYKEFVRINERKTE
jgi:hypothetical protein